MTNGTIQGGAMVRLLMILLFALSACHSGWDKDPLEGQDERIKNAQKPKTVVKKIPPPTQGSLSVNMNYVYRVKEGETLEIPVDFKTYHPEVDKDSVVVKVKDLEEKFPGATYDADNKKIILRPDYEFVPADQEFTVSTLTISFFSEYEGQVEEVTRQIAVHVVPENTLIPQVEKIKWGQRNQVTAGIIQKVQIRVRNAGSEYAPRLRIYDGMNSAIKVSQYFKVNDEGVYDEVAGEWIYEADFAIPKDFYLIGRNGSYGSIEVYAYSVSGIPSRAQSFSFTVYPSTSEPFIATEDEIYFRVGEATDYTFSVYDPYMKGTVKAQCKNAPLGMRCSCAQGKSELRNTYFCTLEWTPPVTAKEKYEMTFVGENKVNEGTPGFKTSVTEKTIEIFVRGVQ